MKILEKIKKSLSALALFALALQVLLVGVAPVTAAPILDVSAGAVPPAIDNISITNDYWGPDYNIFEKSSHLSNGSGLPVVGGAINVAANFSDDKVLTNVQSYLPGKGFFGDNEYVPFPTNNGTWNPVPQGNYSVAWNTKSGADWRSVSDGNYDFTFLAKDMDGGHNGVQNVTTKTVSLTVDNTPAIASFVGTTPASGSLVSGIINVEADFQDANGLMNTMLGIHGIKWVCQTNFPSNGKLSCQIDTREFPNGPQKIVLGAIDKAGNQTWESRDINIDNEAPVVDLDIPTLSLVSGLVQIRGTVEDANPHHYWFVIEGPNGTVNLNPFKTGTISDLTSFSDKLLAEWDTTKGLDGKYVIKLEARDAVDNKGPESVKWHTITVDNTAPTVPVLVSPANNSSVKGVLLVNDWQNSPEADLSHYIYESYNNASATGLRWNQVVNAPVSQKSASNVANTTFWWRVKAVDALGNTSAWSELWKVTIDNTAPVGTVSYSKTTPTNTNIVATLSVNEPVIITNNGGSNSYSFSENGSFTFNFVDEAGNIGNKTVNVSNIDKTKPVIELNGAALVIIEKGEAYKELATVSDNMDTKPTLVVLSLPVDTTAIGDTLLSYTSTDEAGNVSTNFRTVRVVDTTAPSLITALAATPGSATVVLNWTNPTDLDFAGVNIYRGTTPGVFAATPINVALVTGTFYTDPGLTNGTTYYYIFESIDTLGNASTGTGVSGTPVAPLVVAPLVASPQTPAVPVQPEEQAVQGAQTSNIQAPAGESNDQAVKGSEDNNETADVPSSLLGIKVLGINLWIWLFVVLAALGSYYLFFKSRKISK